MKQKFLAAACLLCCAALCGCSAKNPTDTEPEQAETTAELQSTDIAKPAIDDNFVIEDTDAKTVMLGDGTVYLLLDDQALIEKNSEGLVWNYLSNTLRLTFPDDWINRFTIRGTSVYCKACFSAEEFSGELFSINFVDEKSMVSEPKYDALLGVYRGMYVTAKRTEDPNYDSSNNELLAEYTDMANDITTILGSAKVSGNTDYKPLLLDQYAPVTDADHCKLLGRWTNTAAAGDPNQAFTPYAVFRGRDSAFGYKYGENDLAFGTFLVNQKAKDYVWNTDNWGDAGLVFANGCVYRVTYYESAPMTMRFELVSGSPENDMISSSGFSFESEEQAIRQGSGDEFEVEL